MKILGLIPARYASTRFPGKSLAEISGKTMIQWVYERTSQVFEHVYVATDDERIQKAVESFGGKAVMTSSTHQSGTDRCAEALDRIESLLNVTFDIAVNIQGDEPFIQPEQLKKVANCFNDSSIQIATLVKQFSKNEDIFSPNTPKVILNKNDEAIYFSRSVIPFIRSKENSEWQSNHPFYKHIGLYAYRCDILKEITKLAQSPLELAESLEQLRWIENGYRIKVEKTDMETLAVDTPEDLVKVKGLAAKFLSK
ncbi:MAG: 3-deoxy-manno-octulosonate cytidylyltransferase [Bacteroidales bacterium]|nr:MAG: 3-deoxy-manno-octulosonate cytidylyltransferase [Bacteroidales bacterium]